MTTPLPLSEPECGHDCFCNDSHLEIFVCLFVCLFYLFVCFLCIPLRGAECSQHYFPFEVLADSLLFFLLICLFIHHHHLSIPPSFISPPTSLPSITGDVNDLPGKRTAFAFSCVCACVCVSPCCLTGPTDTLQPPL